MAIICQLVRDTGEAVLVRDATEREIWLPRAQIAIEEGMFGRLRITLPLWLARAKGLDNRAASGQGRLF